MTLGASHHPNKQLGNGAAPQGIFLCSYAIQNLLHICSRKNWDSFTTEISALPEQRHRLAETEFRICRSLCYSSHYVPLFLKADQLFFNSIRGEASNIQKYKQFSYHQPIKEYYTDSMFARVRTVHRALEFTTTFQLICLTLPQWTETAELISHLYQSLLPTVVTS